MQNKHSDNATTKDSNMNNQIEISGIVYNVVSAKDFKHNNGSRTDLKLQRPNGRRFYFAVVYENGTISEVA